MVCPICNNVITIYETLVISHIYDDGTFSVMHTRKDGGHSCYEGGYTGLSFDHPAFNK